MSTMRWTEDDVARVVINPIYAVNIAPSLAVEHPTLVGKDDWVRANANLIGELGAEAWLRLLLEVLETGGLAAEAGDEDVDRAAPVSRQQRRHRERRLAKRTGQGR